MAWRSRIYGCSAGIAIASSGVNYREPDLSIFSDRRRLGSDRSIFPISRIVGSWIAAAPCRGNIKCAERNGRNLIGTRCMLGGSSPNIGGGKIDTSASCGVIGEIETSPVTPNVRQGNSNTWGSGHRKGMDSTRCAIQTVTDNAKSNDEGQR